MMVEARNLRAGDYVDLQGDQYADPNRDHISFEFAYIEVAQVERETQGCVAVWFEGFDCVGFPPTHRLKVGRRGPSVKHAHNMSPKEDK